MATVPMPMWGQWSGTNPVWTNSNVGIGTPTPGASYMGLPAVTTSPVLDLKSANPANATLLRLISAPSSPGSYSAGIEFAANDKVNANQSYNVGRIYGVFDAPQWSAGRLTFSTPGGAGMWIDTMTLKNGNVGIGIGTTDPQYKLAVNGNIGAQDIIVTNTGWSDYVFRPDYRLRPLSEVSRYIQKNGHLPDIPTEAEVKEKGVSLGDMQAKLLAKVEELTLHMIRQEEENLELRGRLNRQAKEIQELRQRLNRPGKEAAGDLPTGSWEIGTAMRASKQPRVSGALIRPAIWFCACNLLAAALTAQCTSPTQVPNGAYTSGDHSQVDNNPLAASNFAVSGGATATFAAGNCIHLAPGFRANAIGATAPTTFHAWVDIAPTAVSVSPSSPPQNPPLIQSFTWTVSSPAGRSNLAHVFAVFSATSTSTANACYIHYDASSNLVYLADDTSATWLGGFAPSSSGSIGNSQCTIAGTNSSPNPTSSGAQLGLTLNVTFSPASFSGTKNEYLYALDGSGVSTGWQQMGTWTVPAPPAPDFTLTAASDTYYAPLGGSTPSYSLTVTPQNGFNSPVSFITGFLPIPGCGNASVNPAPVTGPPWTTTITLACNETAANIYWMTVTASGGGKSRQINLYLAVGQLQPYVLTTLVSPSGGGTLSFNPPCCTYPAGTQVTITANPATGYQFTGWSGVNSANGSTATVTMNNNRSVTAIFTQTAISQTITSIPVGLSLTVDGAACPTPCIRQWQAGTNHTISAANQSGGTGTQYSFSGWSDGGAATHPIIAPSSSATYTATFATQYFLTTSSATGGSIIPGPPGAWYNAGAQVEVSAAVNSGYRFSGFSGALTGTATPQRLTLSEPSTVSANFTSLTAPDFTITVNPPQTMPSGQLVSTIPVAITPLNGFSSPVNFAWTNTSSWPTDLTASFAQNPAIGSTNVSIGSSDRTPAGHYSLQFSASAAGNTHSAEIEMPVPDIDIWYSYGLVALDTGDVYAYFATWVTGADAAGARSQVQAAKLSLNGSQILPTTTAVIAYGSDPSFLNTNPFVLSSVGFGTYGFDFYYAQDWCCSILNGKYWQWWQSLRVDCEGSPCRVTYPAPSISSLAPTYALPGATLDLTINGSGLGIADADVNLYRGITSINVYGNGCPSTCGITATVRPLVVDDVDSGGPPPAAPSAQASITVSSTAQSGTYQISVTAFGVESNRVNFVIGDSTPVINYITQQTLQSGQQGSISIYGSNFGTGCSNVACTGAGISVCRSSDNPCGSSDVVPVSITYWSDTQINATLSAGPSASGSYDVQVTSAGAAGFGFSPTPAQTTSSQSNRKSIAVNSNPNVSLRVTSNGSTLNQLNCAYVTGDPAMPQVAASIVANDGSSVAGTATWQINTTFPHKKRDPSTKAEWWETDSNSTPSSPVSLAANQTWQPSFQSIFGGNAAIKWTYNGQEQPAFNFYICGTNPDYGTVSAVLDASPYWFARKLALHETNVSQFCESGRMDSTDYCAANANHFGWPVLGPPAGYGMMQLDPAATPGLLWNWRTNADGGKTRLDQLAGPQQFTNNDDGRAYPFWIRQVQQWNQYNRDRTPGSRIGPPSDRQETVVAHSHCP